MQSLTKKEISISQWHNRPSLTAQEPPAQALGIKLAPYSEHQAFWDRYISRITISAKYYNFLAGALKLRQPQARIFIHHLQAEPLNFEKNKTYNLDVNQLEKQLLYARETRIRSIDVFGAEWWSYEKKRQNPVFWDKVDEIISHDF